MAQRQQIEKDIAEKQPLIGEKLPISCLVAEYDPAQSPSFHSSALSIQKKAVAFSLCEISMQKPAHLERMLKLMEEWKVAMDDFGYKNLSIDEFFETFNSILLEIKGGMDKETLLRRFNDQFVSNYAVVSMRLITFGYMRKHEKDFEGFIENGVSVQDYCSREVQPMGRECDHVSILALISALDIPLQIEYMDQSTLGTHHNFNTADGKPPILYFLYRPVFNQVNCIFANVVGWHSNLMHILRGGTISDVIYAEVEWLSARFTRAPTDVFRQNMQDEML
uniref:ubiquitinyl hydrolase 1 n=1 Tax=Trichuris muris TaxID=70415 RepID=A0A5S6PYS9_TRIMR